MSTNPMQLERKCCEVDSTHHLSSRNPIREEPRKSTAHDCCQTSQKVNTSFWQRISTNHKTLIYGAGLVAVGSISGALSYRTSEERTPLESTLIGSITAAIAYVLPIAIKGVMNYLRPQAKTDASSQQANDKHLVIVGGGSAAFSAAITASDLGARVTIINSGLPIGGTCVNVGCVPSKTLIRAAETLHRASQSRFQGIETRSRLVSFKEVIAQKRDLVESLRQAKYLDVVSDNEKIRIIAGRAKLISRNTVEVNSEVIRGDRLLISTGTSPYIPPIKGLEETGYLTNETAFELEELPKSMIVLGGRYIALECAQMFARMGSEVTILQRSSRILPDQTEDITSALTDFFREEGIRVITGVKIRGASRHEENTIIHTEVEGMERSFSAEKVLVATGVKPNTQGIGLEKFGIQRDEKGFIQVDQELRTSIEGIYAAGDVIGDPKFVYASAYEGGLAARNSLINASMKTNYTALPWVVFTDPQLAGVGLDEREAARMGINFDIAVLPLSHVPRSIAARDTRGFIKLIRNKDTDLLIGARILAPEGSELLMEVCLAIKHQITVKELRNAFHPYLTLSEGIKLATITFGKDVGKLSCCAV